ncbi:MAG: hypothetical protein H7X93_05400 [Sphingomonadaceae bacterium]|nr:hypothetical protein [Sphingomonadaceae bacterium]
MTGFRNIIWGAALAGVLVAGSPAAARTEIAPYIEVQQVFDADLSSSGGAGNDVVTYTAVAAGVDAHISTRRIEVGASYRYERRIDWQDDLANDDVHSGLVRGRVQLTRGLSLEAGALAARARTESGGADPGFGVGDSDNESQVYSAYAGPTFSTQVGDLQVGGGYQLGYTHVEDNLAANQQPGRPPVDYADSSTYHQASASVGMAPGTSLPFGWIASGAWAREDADQLDQRYESRLARLDVTVPVSATLALLGGVGYENVEITQDDILVDADGDPVLDANGRLQSDEAAPRLLAYETDGLIYDVGLLWRPSPRLELAAHVGWRYDSVYYQGHLGYQIDENSGLVVSVYNTVDSFGRSTVNTIAGMPTDFELERNPFGQFSNCAFGGSGENPGNCFNNGFASVNSSNFRSRGAALVYSGGRGRLSYGIGAGYQHRRYLAPVETNANFELASVTEENFAVQGNVGYQLTSRSAIDGALYANWFNSGLPGAGDAFGIGAAAGYSIDFMEGLTGRASAGIFASDVDEEESQVDGSLLLGLRYGF